MTLPVLDIFTLTEDDVAIPIVCESQHCEIELKKPAHEAQFYGLFPCCLFIYAVCRERVEDYAEQPRVHCNCGAIVDGLSITVTEIER